MRLASNRVKHFFRFSLCATLASGCAGDKTTPVGSNSGPSSPTISGTLRYERVPHRSTGEGLDYAATFQMPMRGVAVHLMGAVDNREIAITTTAEDGSYSFEYDKDAPVKLWIYAETLDPPISVEDNTDGNAVYVLESELIDPRTKRPLDLTARTGFVGDAFVVSRSAAPFAILDSVYEAASRFSREVSPKPDFPPLKINWSVENRPEKGSVSKGQIGTSHWDHKELYILGKSGVDTDEFDDHVIVHEWGHFLESKLARSDSPGGKHSYGDLLDPRVALSEGFCNALSAMILEPDTVYADAMGVLQQDGFAFDLELNDKSQSSSPGWFSESSIETLLFDVYDAKNEPHDQVDMGLQGVYGVLTGGLKDTPAMTTLFSFLGVLKAGAPTEAAELDALTAFYSIDGDHGIDPIVDDWATGESHSGGVAGSLPIYRDVSPGATISLGMEGGELFNTISQSRFLRILGTGGPLTITLSAAPDVDLYLYDHGKLVSSADGPSGDELISFDSQAMGVYVLNVVGHNAESGSYTAKVVVSP